MKVPFSLAAEYRGQSPAGEADIDGQQVEWSPGMKFEVQLPDGDVDIWTVRQAKLDQVGDFDASTLTKGQEVELTGSATIGTKQGERSFIQISSARLATSNGRSSRSVSEPAAA